jgi:RNA polymerase sigma-70 factor (ECF subfamily)
MNDSKTTDSTMIPLQHRYEAMVKALGRDVYRYAFFLCRNEALADDITQETFLRAWRFLPGLRDDTKAKSWLFTTVRREFARQFERYQPVLEELDPERVPGGDELDTDTWMVRRAILQLPEKYREVLVLQAMAGYTGTEISQLLGIPRPTVNTRLFRARAHLRRMLDGEVTELGDARKAIP